MPIPKQTILGALFHAALLTGVACAAETPNQETQPMQLESTVFSHQGEIPVRFTCDGGDVSPPLNWSDLPAGTKSLALIVDDPDAPDPKAPKMTWVHWVLYNLPADAKGLPEAVKAGNLLGSHPCDWIPAVHAGMTGLLHLRITARAPLGNAVLEAPASRAIGSLSFQEIGSQAELENQRR